MDLKNRPKSVSLFSVRENWKLLTKRRSFQEPVIDGVRAMAILWVVALHMVFYHSFLFPAHAMAIFHNPFTSWVQNGAMGVDLFFVISGYLMGSILFEEAETSKDLSFARFYVRRFLRLVPAYLVAMLFGIYLLRGHNLGNAWANLVYVNNLLPIAKQYMSHCWSLAIEEQFYLVLPAFMLLFLRFGKGRIGILLSLMVVSMTIRFSVIHASGIVPPLRFALGSPAYLRWFDVIYDKPWMRFGGLLAGVTGAYLNCYFQPRLKRFFARTRLVTAISLVCIAFLVYVARTPVYVGTAAPFGSFFLDRLPLLARELWYACALDTFSLATMFLILAAMHTPRLFGGVLRNFLSWRGFYPIAQLSYSVYLIHEMVFERLFPRIAFLFAARLGAMGTMAIDSAIGVAVTLGFSLFFYLLIEQPSIRLRAHPKIAGLIDHLSFSASSVVPDEKVKSTGLKSRNVA